MPTLHELQQEVIQAEAKVNELREKLNQQKNNERAQAIASVKELVELHQLSAADLGLTYKNSGKIKKADKINKTTRANKGTTVAAKYADPLTGKTWSGRGRTPTWLDQYLTAGKAKIDYLIGAKP